MWWFSTYMHWVLLGTVTWKQTSSHSDTTRWGRGELKLLLPIFEEIIQYYYMQLPCQTWDLQSIFILELKICTLTSVCSFLSPFSHPGSCQSVLCFCKTSIFIMEVTQFLSLDTLFILSRMMSSRSVLVGTRQNHLFSSINPATVAWIVFTNIIQHCKFDIEGFFIVCFAVLSPFNLMETQLFIFPFVVIWFN